MALDANSLTSGIQGALALGVVPPPANADSDTIALAIAAAYNAYALLGQSCKGLTPTVVSYIQLQDLLKDALQGTSPDAASAAAKWEPAFTAYWMGGTPPSPAMFGPTGMVVAVTGSAALISGLTNLFTTKTNTLANVAQSIASELDTYTRAVQVTDTAIPPCGPLGIT